MSDEYFQIIISTLEKLKKDTGYVWAYEQTGGGCDAFMLHFNGNNEDDGYYMVTCDASIPTNEAEWSEITVGQYDGIESEAVQYIDGVHTYEGLVTWLEFVAPKLSQWKFA